MPCGLTLALICLSEDFILTGLAEARDTIFLLGEFVVELGGLTTTLDTLTTGLCQYTAPAVQVEGHVLFHLI